MAAAETMLILWKRFCDSLQPFASPQTHIHTDFWSVQNNAKMNRQNRTENYCCCCCVSVSSCVAFFFLRFYFTLHAHSRMYDSNFLCGARSNFRKSRGILLSIEARLSPSLSHSIRSSFSLGHFLLCRFVYVPKYVCWIAGADHFGMLREYGLSNSMCALHTHHTRLYTHTHKQNW